VPLFYLRRLTGRHRSEAANRHLAWYLAFVAGASDAGGFFAAHHYTSHMSGVVSSMASDTALGNVILVLIGLASVLSFFCGSFLTTLFVRWARAKNMESVYALPLLAEAVLLLLFGLQGRVIAEEHDAIGLIVLLCFSMGLQNAIITKLSDAVIRTTHVTGMVTDIGIAAGRILSAKWKAGDVDVEHEADTVRLLGALIVLFFTGGVIGALGFRHIGFVFTLPLALILVTLAALPIVADLRRQENVTT
jgi:uncharacterized membrane protein YoaK (UPF0700 family)